MNRPSKLLIISIIALAVAYPVVATASQTPYSPTTRVTTVMKTSTNDIGAQLAFPATTHPEATMLHVTVPAHGTTGWHRHPFQGFAFVLSGDLTIESKGHPPITYHPGQGFAESIDTVHQGVNHGRVPVELFVVFLGIQGHPFAMKAQWPSSKPLPASIRWVVAVIETTCPPMNL